MNKLRVLQVLMLLSMILIQSACSSVDLPLQIFNSTTDHSKLESIRDKRQIFM